MPKVKAKIKILNWINIYEGDTPENNEFAAHALKLIDMVLANGKQEKSK